MTEIESLKTTLIAAGTPHPRWAEIFHSYNQQHLYAPTQKKVTSIYSLSSRWSNIKREMEALIARNQQVAVIPAPTPAASSNIYFRFIH